MSSNPLDIFLPQKPAPEEAWRWGMVTQVSPLRIRLDGDTGSLNGTPSNVAGNLSVGQRVYVHVQRGMTPVVVGAADSGHGVAQVVAMERGERSVSHGTITTLTGYTTVTTSGNAMSAGAFSVAILKPGWYTASAAVRWGSNSVGARQLRIMEGDAVIRAYAENPAGNLAQQVTTGPMYLTPASAPLRVMVYQSSGSTIEVINHSEGQYSSNYLRVNYLGEQG